MLLTVVCRVLWLLAAVGAVLGGVAAAELPDDLFEQHVRPLFLSKCAKCHGDEKSESGLQLTSRQALVTGGDSGMGRYHGKAGFDTFSHYRSLMHRSLWPDIKIQQIFNVHRRFLTIRIKRCHAKVIILGWFRLE